MNFVPAALFDVGSCDRLGFRPEWATLDDGGQIPGVVTRTRVQSTRNGMPYGLVTLATPHGELSVRTAIGTPVGRETALRVCRYVAFAERRKVSEGEIV
jgi:hypothetical protein